MKNVKNIYAPTNNKQNNVAGDLNLDGRGPDGAAKAFKKSREEALLEYVVRHMVRKILKEQPEQRTVNITQPIPRQQQPQNSNNTLSTAKTQAGFVSKADREAARQAAWEEIEDLRKHLEDLRKKDTERLAAQPSKVNVKQQRMVALPPLPANLTADFVKRVNNIVSWLEKSSMPAENRLQIDNQIYQIVADASKTEAQKIKNIKSMVGSQLNLINKAKMHLSNLNEDAEYQKLMEI